NFEKARQLARCQERKAMPREYDPRRYGPIASRSRAPVSSRSVFAARAGEVRREGQLLFSTSPRRGGRLSSQRQRQRRVGVGGERSWPSRSEKPKWQVASRGLRSFAEEAAVSHGCVYVYNSADSIHGESRRTAAPKGGTRGERASRQLHARRAPFKGIDTTASTCLESTRDTADAAAATSGSGDAAAAADTSHESRGRTRRRSLSSHCRQKLGGGLQQRQQLPATTPTHSFSAFCSSPSAFSSHNYANMLIDDSGRINDGRCSCCTTPRQQYFFCESMLRSTSCGSSGSSVSSGNEAAGGREGGTRCDARGRRRGRSAGEPGGKERGSGGAGRGERIDAEKLFRRKNKMASFNVTYGRWAESYDRGMARRASLERRERLEIERENDLRRQRAEEEFQKWMRSHGRRSTSASGGTAAAAATAATTPTAAPALGARSSYHERASSASPRRRRR
ncbi:unnamed protein product, partial [Ectocarpus sp. 12 AP-2014]